MTEDEGGRRTRTPGVQYPGSSLSAAADVARHIDEGGGRISIGRLAGLVGQSENAATFKRLIISARAFGLVDWANEQHTVLALTENGTTVLHGDPDQRRIVLQRALVAPPVFRQVAQQLAGRQMPSREGLTDLFRTSGVAPVGAPLAADNFDASATFAEAVETVGERRLLSADIEFPEPEPAAPAPVAPARSRGTSARPGAPALAERKSSAQSRGSTPPDPGKGTTSPLRVEVRLDVSGWSVDQVVELINRVRTT